MKLVAYGCWPEVRCVKDSGENVEFLETEHEINGFVAAANRLSVALKLFSLEEVRSFSHFNDVRFKKMLKHVSAHCFVLEDVMFVPVVGLDKEICGELDVEADLELLRRRFLWAQEMDFLAKDVDFGEIRFRNPDFLCLLLDDDGFWAGLGEVLYAGFFKKNCEIWDFYYPPVDSFPNDEALRSAKGILISGGRYSCCDNSEWVFKLLDFFKKIVTDYPGIQVVGLCLSHQLISRALGGQVGKNPTREFILGAEIIKCKKSVEGLPDSLKISQSHSDCVLEAPEKAEIIYCSDSCDIEGVYISPNILTFQGHPEFTTSFMKHIFTPAVLADGDISHEKYHKINESIDNLDSLVLIRYLNDFLRGKKLIN